MSKPEKSPEGNININIANVIKWFQESENCVLHNHAQEIPTTQIGNCNLVQSIIDNNYC
jgi:hypothetical protein